MLDEGESMDTRVFTEPYKYTQTLRAGITRIKNSPKEPLE
jgi:hypothetical protein